jgi:hypothetical protein
VVDLWEAIAVDLRVALVVASRVVRAADSHEERAAAFTAAVDTGNQPEANSDRSERSPNENRNGWQRKLPAVFVLMPANRWVVIPAPCRFPFSGLN